MDNGVARIPSSGSRSGSRLPSGDQAANAARGQTASAASGRSLGNPLGLTNPLNAQADAAGVPNPGQHHVPAQDAAARTWRAQSHRQRFLAGLRSAVSCTNASAVSTTLSPEQTIDAWLSWAQMPHAALYEKRDDAAQRVIASVMGEGQDPHSLNLAGLGLRGELPPLPEHLTRLTIARNPGITTLASIPASLIRLNADRCGLVQLPAFPEGSQLQELNVSYNPHLHTLPPLPPSLIELALPAVVTPSLLNAGRKVANFAGSPPFAGCSSLSKTSGSPLR